MVEKTSYPEWKGDSSSSGVGLAAPKDRLAAYVVDTILLLPLVQLFQAPIKKWILESFIFGSSDQAVFLQAFSAFIFILVFIGYYTVMTWWGGQTIGKKFFSIKVISYHGSVSFFQAFMRSFMIFCELALFGLPLLGVFSHSLRRPIHDRVADSLVISLKSPVSYPSSKEKWKAHFASVAIMLCFAVTIFTYYFVYFVIEEPKSFSFEQKQNCRQLVKDKNQKVSSAIELFMAQKISGECLYKKARESLWSNVDTDLSQLAMALAYVDNAETSDLYLKEVCKTKKEGSACLFSQWVQGGFSTEENDPFIHWVVEGKDIPGFYKVYLASVYKDKGLYGKVLETVKDVDDSKVLKPFVSLLSFESLLSVGEWSQAYWIYQTSEYVETRELVNHLVKVRAEESLSQQKQLALLEMFFPYLVKENSGGRGIASNKKNQEIFTLYQMIKEGQ